MKVVNRLKSLAGVDPYGDLGSEGTSDRLLKLLSPRWLVSRFVLTAYERRYPDRPWITQEAVSIFDALLRPHHSGFEWGSGNGTCWIARRCRSLVSIEHSRPWYDHVSALISAQSLTNVDYRFLAEEEYVDSIGAFPEESLDFVVIDGLWRGPTLLRSIPKVKPDGFIVFDNVNWYLPSTSRTPHSRSHDMGPLNAHFAEISERLRSWKTHWTSNGVNDTAIFIKPVR